jgi:hypothetical protein
VHDDTTLLLGLDGVVVDRVELDPDGGRVVYVSTLHTGHRRCGVSVVSVVVKLGEGVGPDQAT